MKWNCVTVVFESNPPALGEEVISDLFFSLGLTGVVCQVPLPAPDEGFGSDALPGPEHHSVSGYLPEGGAAEATIERLCSRCRDLASDGILTSVGIEKVDEEDWAESWKAHFHVNQLTDRIVIKPAWEPYKPEHGQIVIDIDPGMAFGTGTHPTTAMCVELIERHLKKGTRFLDVGTGSGILMAVASRLGATPLVGLDTDIICMDIARSNLLKNQIPESDLTLVHGTLESLDPAEHGPYDMITANILAEVILEILPRIRSFLSQQGIAILSGIINARKAAVIAEAERQGLQILEVLESDEWIALAACQSHISREEPPGGMPVPG